DKYAESVGDGDTDRQHDDAGRARGGHDHAQRPNRRDQAVEWRNQKKMIPKSVSVNVHSHSSWKLETGNWKLENEEVADPASQFPVSNFQFLLFQFPFSSFRLITSPAR